MSIDQVITGDQGKILKLNDQENTNLTVLGNIPWTWDVEKTKSIKENGMIGRKLYLSMPQNSYTIAALTMLNSGHFRINVKWIDQKGIFEKLAFITIELVENSELKELQKGKVELENDVRTLTNRNRQLYADRENYSVKVWNLNLRCEELQKKLEKYEKLQIQVAEQDSIESEATTLPEEDLGWKIDAETVRQGKILYGQGKSVRDVASQLGLSLRTAQRIRERWVNANRKT